MSRAWAFYNEIDPAAAHVLRALIADGVIAPGEVDTRSIKEVHPDDLRGFTQAHFFAGAGLWSVAARLAGWPDDRPMFSGSCPCQPFSVAGKGAGEDDHRHLWPDFFRLIRSCRPHVVMGEQVAAKAGYGWFDGVASDLEGEGYTCGAVDIPACAVDAPHIRNRIYWIGTRHGVALGDSTSAGRVSSAFAGICGEAQSERPRHVEPERPYGVHGRALADADESGRGRRAFEPVGYEVGRTAVEGNAQGGVAMVNSAGDGRREGRPEPEFQCGRHAFASANALGVGMADADKPFLQGQPPAGELRQHEQDGGVGRRNGSYWSGAEWITCYDGKARRVPEPSVRHVSHGVPRADDCVDPSRAGCFQGQEIPWSFLVKDMPGRIDAWRIAGNSIVPQLAAEVIRAFLDVEGLRQ